MAQADELRSERPGGYVAMADNEGSSLYGAPWLQRVAITGKATERTSGENKRPLPRVATGCRV